MTRPELLVMAAGMGSRFGGLKQVEPVGPAGETVMDYGIYDAARAGVERVVFVIREGIERDFRRLVGDRFAGRMDVGYALQDAGPAGGRARPWGTGHAVLSARGAVGGPFMAVNADDFYGRRAYGAMAGWLAESPESSGGRANYALVAFRMRNTLSRFGAVARGVCGVGAGGELVSVREHTGLVASGGGARDVAPDGAVTEFDGTEPVSMNFWGFRPSVFGLLEGMFAEFMDARGRDAESEFYLPGAVDRMVGSGLARVQVLETPDRWFGVTYRGDAECAAARVRELVAAGEYPVPLWGGP
jgi:hypothetical protein